MNRRIVAALVLTLLVTLTACQQGYAPGPSGTVTDRSFAYFKSGGWRFWLTVGDSKFRVPKADYRACFRGSHYPTCTNH